MGDILKENGISPKLINFYKPILRWAVFFHDLAKAICPLVEGHDVMSANLAVEFFLYQNKQSDTDKYSEDFILLVENICKNHHFFQKFKEAGFCYGQNVLISDEVAARIKCEKNISSIDDLAEIIDWKLDEDGKLLLWMIYLFTIADIEARDPNSEYIAENYFVMRTILAVCNRLAVI